MARRHRGEQVKRLCLECVHGPEEANRLLAEVAVDRTHHRAG